MTDTVDTISALKKLNNETRAKVFIVGGFVRDYLRNETNNDLDVVVRNLPLSDIKKFLQKYGVLKEVVLSKISNKLAAINILLFRAFPDEISAQILLPRRGKKQVQGIKNTLKQDAMSRDFKVNGMYLPINFSSKKDVIDFVGGKKDMSLKRISAVENKSTDRIQTSPIRMLRAISIAARTKFYISKDFIKATRRNAELIATCPVEGIRIEFNKILMSNKPSDYLRLLNKVGLLKYISPELQDCVNVTQDNRYHSYDVFTHLIYTVDNCDKDIIIRLAGLLHDIGKPITRKEYKEGGETRVTFHKHEMYSAKLAKEFLTRLRYDTDTIKKVVSLVRLHMFHYTRDWTDPAMRRFIVKAGLGKEFMTEKNISSFPLFRLRAAERLGSGLKEEAVTDRQRDFEKRLIEVYNESKALETKDLKINGDTIINVFNIKQGVEVGNILKFLLEKVLEKPSINEELELLKLTTEYLHKNK